MSAELKARLLAEAEQWDVVAPERAALLRAAADALPGDGCDITPKSLEAHVKTLQGMLEETTSPAEIDALIAAIFSLSSVPVVWEMKYPTAMPAMHLIAAPGFVRSLARAESIASQCLTHYGQAATYRALAAAPQPETSK